MSHKVSSVPLLPRCSTFRNDPRVCLDHLITHLTTLLAEIAYHINNSVFSVHGDVRMMQPAPLLSIVAADLGNYPAADWTGSIIYVSDGAAGAKFRGSDGTNWVNLG